MDKGYTWYKCSINGTEDIEIVDGEKAIIIFDEYNGELKEKYETDDEAIKSTMFGFSIDKNTFLEISIDKKNSYRIKFENPTPKSFLFLKWQGLYQKEYHINSKSSVDHVIKSFFSKELSMFQKYFDELNFKISV